MVFEVEPNKKTTVLRFTIKKNSLLPNQILKDFVFLKSRSFFLVENPKTVFTIFVSQNKIPKI